jgi:phage-related protein
MSGANVPPPSHIEDALQLEAAAYVHLFKLDLLPSGFIAFTRSQQLTWQGIEYEAIQCQISGLGSYATDQVSRPRLDVQNPDAAFSALVAQGGIEGARLTRYRVLRADAKANRNVYVAHSWRVSRIVMLTRIRIQAELRELGDGPNFVIPATTFSPPDFPVVSVR